MYRRLRQPAEPLVGWQTEQPALRNLADFQLVLETLNNPLPPDRLDVRYPPPLLYRR